MILAPAEFAIEPSLGAADRKLNRRALNFASIPGKQACQTKITREGTVERPVISAGQFFKFFIEALKAKSYELIMLLPVLDKPSEPRIALRFAAFEVDLGAGAVKDPNPVWSSDGRSVAFLRIWDARAIDVVLTPALGGPERKLVEFDATLDFGRGTRSCAQLRYLVTG